MNSEINLRDNSAIILENVPPGTEVGIDYHAWYVGPTFRGIVNIPPGFHFLFYSSVDKYNDKAPRSGFFIFLQPGDVIVKLFDRENERLGDDERPVETQRQQYMNEIETIGKYLAPYPSKECTKWFPLTRYITEDVMRRVQPECGNIDYLTTVPVETAGKQRKSIREIDSRIIEKVDTTTMLRFTKLKCDLPEGLSSQELSKINMDSSFFVEDLITRISDREEDILGELQFAFISFLIGQIYDAFEHWKLLVTMLSSCFDCLSSRTRLFSKYIDAVSDQIDEIPEDYFVDITAQHNFLLKTFQTFFQNFESGPEGVSGELLKKVSLLKHKLTSQFEWEFEEEDEEDLPVVVQM